MSDSSASVAAYGGRGPLILGITWSEAAVALILIALRAKGASLAPSSAVPNFFGLRWDFIWVMFSLVLALTAQSFMTVSARYGLGNHEGLLSPENIVLTNLWSWIAQILAILALAVSRIAVIAFLLAIQAGTNRQSRLLLYIVGSLQATINVIEVVLILKQCDPTPRLWNPSIPGTCKLIKICSQVGFLQGSIGAASDMFLAFYPVFIIGRLQMMRTTVKISLCLIMGSGVVAAIAGINKTVAIASITQTSDITFAIYRLNTWVLTEMWFIIICGTIPVLRPFFVRVMQSIKTGGHSSEHSAPAGYTADRIPNNSWMPLSERTAQSEYISKRGESQEDILPPPEPDKILVTSDVTVASEQRT